MHCHNSSISIRQGNGFIGWVLKDVWADNTRKCLHIHYSCDFGLRRPLIVQTYDQWCSPIVHANEKKHEFLGMLGNINCIHWTWALYPSAWCDQYMWYDHKELMIILHASVFYDIWIWHAFFDLTWANNDINVLD